MMWTWPIVSITMQDYRGSSKDMTNNSMTTDDGERIYPYTKNDPDGILPVSHWICTMAEWQLQGFCVVSIRLHSKGILRNSRLQRQPHMWSRTALSAIDTNDHVHIHDNSRPADILSSRWSYRNVWNMLRSILFWHDNTEDFHRTVGECQLCTHSMYFYVVAEYCILVYVRCT